MKRWLSLTLAAALAGSLAAPAAAAESGADERLAAVTAQVKATLDLDTSAFSVFHGEAEEHPLVTTWRLEWTAEDDFLTVSVLEDGKILSLYRRDNGADPVTSSQLPAFPAGDRESAKAAAQAFLDKVLTEGETAAFHESGAMSLGSTRWRFNGEVLCNGLSTGMAFSVSVRCTDNEILSFARDDLTGYTMGEVPSPTPQIPAAQAAAALRETLALRLEYVLPEGEDARAVLRYLPEYGDTYYVDAATGETVNLSRLSAEAEKGPSNGMGMDAEEDNMAAAPEGMLLPTPAEQEGIAALEGVLDRQALDAKARAVSQLGLDKYSLSAVSYSVPREDDGDGTVRAVLRYGKQVEDVTWRRNVTLDARTGELLAVSSSGLMPEDGPARTVSFADAQRTAEAFLRRQDPGRFAKTELYDSTQADGESRWASSHTFSYAQKEAGYFFPGNAFSVSIDVTDGSISAYEKHFDDAVTFDRPDGLLTMDQALDAWLDTYTVKLNYVVVPSPIDFSQAEFQPLEGLGITHLYRLVLGYSLDRAEYVSGLDAKTGEPVFPASRSDSGALTYDDLAGHWAQAQIETLAQFRVGYAGGSFQPGKALTQLDLIALLASVQGYLYRPDEPGAADALYDYAVARGLLERQERSDGAVLTRIQTVVLLLNAAGYGPIARLEGIFQTGFADDREIPAGDYGYAALAQGLGVVSGAPGSRLLPRAEATRAEAAVMLYNLMNH